MGLAARSRSGFFRKAATSDPYFIVVFKSKRYASESRSQTSDPVWKRVPFQLGWINGVEKAELKLQLFASNAEWADDCIGTVCIPGYILYHLGLGDHTFWVDLTTSNRRLHRSRAVSGRVLLHFRIDGCQHDFAACPYPPNHRRPKSDPAEFRNLTNISPGESSGAPRNSSVRVHSKEKVSAALHRCFTHLMVSLFRTERLRWTTLLWVERFFKPSFLISK